MYASTLSPCILGKNKTSLSLERYSSPTIGPGDDIPRMRKMNDVENHVGD
jgi:hypothetical protein